MVPKVTVLRDVTPDSLADMYQDFRGPSWPLFPTVVQWCNSYKMVVKVSHKLLCSPSY